MSFLSPVSVALLAFTIFFVINMPIGFAMIIASMVYHICTGSDLSIVIEIVCNKVSGNYIMLAVPLFIFAANVMNEGNITEHVFNFAKSIIGRRRGSMAYVNILASFIFSGMTGSAVADAAGLGVMEIAAMKKDGYDLAFSGAITAASAVIGPIFPPSIPFLIYAMIAEVSVGKMFLAGMIPGIMLAIALAIYVNILAKKRNYPSGEKITFKEFLSTSKSALPAILTPVILLTGIYTGITTATEAAAIACLYALIVSTFIYHSMTIKKLYIIIKNSLITSAQVGIILAGAYAFTYITALSGIPRMAGVFLSTVVTSKTLFLIMLNILLLILGALLNSAVIQFLTLPILIPMAELYGIDLVHFGLIFTFNIMIGLCTPPVGTLIFITSGLTKEKISNIVKELMPMVGFMLLVQFIITYLPQTFMWVPDLIFGK